MSSCSLSLCLKPNILDSSLIVYAVKELNLTKIVKIDVISCLKINVQVIIYFSNFEKIFVIC